MSCSGRYGSTLAIRLASWARVSSSQKTAGAPVARARVTASLTQSRIGTSLVWHIRQMSPALDRRARAATSPAASTTRTVPAAGISKVLSWRAVLLGRLRHQPDVGHRAHRGRVEGAVGAAVVDDDLVDAGVAQSGITARVSCLLAVRAPHVAGGADHRRHRGVDDHVARHVQVGDALVGVDHRERRAVGEPGLDGGLDLGAVSGSVSSAGEDGAEAVVRADARRRRARRRTPRTASGRRPARRGRR